MTSLRLRSERSRGLDAQVALGSGGVGQRARGRRPRVRRNQTEPTVNPPGPRVEVRTYLKVVEAGGATRPGDGRVGSLRSKVEGSNAKLVPRKKGISVRQVFLQVGRAVAVAVAGGVHGRQVSGVTQFPRVGQAVAVTVDSECDRIGLDEGDGVTQADPAEVGAVNESAETSGAQIDFWAVKRRASGVAIGEDQPADVCAPGQAVKVSDVVVVHAKVVRGVVLITI